MQTESQDDMIRRGARQVRLQLLTEQFASSSDVHDANHRRMKTGGTSSSSQDYRELLYITPKETLEKLKELDDLHAQTEMRGLARLRKLQMLEGRIQNNESMRSRSSQGSRSSGGGSTSTGSSALENYSYRQPSISSVSHRSNGSSKLIQPQDIATMDLRSKGGLKTKTKDATTQARSSATSSSSLRMNRSSTIRKSRSFQSNKSAQNVTFALPPESSTHDCDEKRSPSESPLRNSVESKYEDNEKPKSHYKCKSIPIMTPFRAEDDLLTEEHVSVTMPMELQKFTTKVLTLPRHHSEKSQKSKECSIMKEEHQFKSSQALEEYRNIKEDSWKQSEAYIHAMKAGVLWQTLVGEHVRFPKEWFDGARTPSMSGEGSSVSKWRYIARNKVRNSSLNKLVKRKGGGRILLHVVVRDAVTQREKEDIVLGCFHAQSRGLIPEEEYRYIRNTVDIDVRDVWIAFRTRCKGSNRSNLGMTPSTEISMTQPLLTCDRPLNEVSRRSPLYSDEKLSNDNIRAVFGSEPALETVFVLETDLVKVLEENSYSYPSPIAVVLMQNYLFR